MTLVWKRRLTGAAMGLAGALIWALMAVGWNNRNSSDWPWSTPLYAAYAVLVAGWFVLPLGAIVGTVLPRLVSGRSRRSAFARGVLVGIVAGVIAATAVVVWFNVSSLTGQTTIVDKAAWRRGLISQFIWVVLSMSTVCALWVGAWACVLNRIESRSHTLVNHVDAS
jgi:hypothetical protein